MGKSGCNYEVNHCAAIHQGKKCQREVENECLSIPVLNMSMLFE